MKTLVLQCESARLLGTLVDTDSGRVINEVVVDDVLESEAAFRQILERLGTAVESIAVVAHRVPREGTRPYGTVAIDDAFEEQMAALPSLSREFQPSCLGTIRAARKLLPKASSIAVFNTATLIARAATEFALREPAANEAETVPIAISARHVHLTVETIEALFGRGYELQPYRPLSQPGQYAAQETLTIVGPKGRIENVRVLG
ncbi:MAG: hypothetical protein KDI32_01715, partial [Pseudomonadales bacterium]|nr:hypothetical protein [Pseudomonadales bacterium]